MRPLLPFLAMCALSACSALIALLPSALPSASTERTVVAAQVVPGLVEPFGQPLPLAIPAGVPDAGSPGLTLVAPADTPLLLAPDSLAPAAAAGPIRVSDADPPQVTAHYFAIVDEESGGLLYDQGASVRVPPASVTKIATTLVALQREPDLRRVIPITINGFEMAALDGSQVMGIEPGEELRLETLLYGAMLWSGNDAAEQIALALSDGSRERYVGWMNELMRGLGLQNTQFVNPSGMDARGHYSSAADMAYLARYAMRDPMFQRLARTQFTELEGYKLPNLNRLLGSYPGADGVKIGYTGSARRTMVASAVDEGHRVYVSLMRSEDLVGDSTALFNWVWRTFRWERALPATDGEAGT